MPKRGVVRQSGSTPSKVKENIYPSSAEIRILDENFGKDLGLLHEACITGKKVGFGRHEWTMLTHDEYLFSRAKRMIHAHIVRLGWLPEEVREAIKILGPANVLHHFDVMSVWAADLEHDRNSFRFVPDWREVLENCADQNRRGNARWVLAFHPGFSLNEQIIRTGYHSWSLLDGYNLGFSYGGYDLQSVEKDGIPTGYRLINFKPRFTGLGFADRVAALKEISSDYSIAPASVVSAAVLASDRLNGDKLLSDVHHDDGEVVVYVRWPEDGMQDAYLDYNGASSHHSTSSSLIERKFQIFEEDEDSENEGGSIHVL